MDYDISQPIPQGGDGAQDAENSRIAAITDELERLCTVHEACVTSHRACPCVMCVTLVCPRSGLLIHTP